MSRYRAKMVKFHSAEGQKATTLSDLLLHQKQRKTTVQLSHSSPIQQKELRSARSKAKLKPNIKHTRLPTLARYLVCSSSLPCKLRVRL